jgi:LPS export ABC transporter protein LptC
MRRSSSALVAMMIAVMLGACGKKSGQQTTVGDTQLPDETVTDFTTQETDSGRVRWTLHAPHADRFNAKNTFVMESPKIEFYDQMGNLQTTLTARNGEYLLTTHDMLAYGNVVAVTTKGEILETDSLKYINKTDKIVSDSFVKLTRGKDVVTGIGLECDHTLSSVDIKKNVKARIVDENGKLGE